MGESWLRLEEASLVLQDAILDPCSACMCWLLGHFLYSVISNTVTKPTIKAPVISQTDKEICLFLTYQEGHCTSNFDGDCMLCNEAPVLDHLQFLVLTSSIS